ncbi:unnamed protein product [Alopecurus aequalis]
MAEPKGKKGTRTYQTWSNEMDTALLTVLVEHHNLGDHAQNGWKPHVYNACIRHVREKCGVEITKDNITARIKTFDKHYEVVSKMLAQSGFGWDWENNKVSVDSEEVWSRYVEANKAAACYRNKVVMNWDAINTIYSKDHATGAGARTGGECVQQPDTVAAEESPDVVPPKRQRTGNAILCMMGDMKTTFGDALKTTEPVPMPMPKEPKVTPPTEILDVLQKVPGLGDDDMLMAYGKLIKDERLVEALIALPLTLRKKWLLTLA